VELFCSILGGFAGDVALMYGAWDGVYLGGGMTVTLLPWICRGEFRRRFENKGRFGSLMQTIPTFAITHPQPVCSGLPLRRPTGRNEIVLIALPGLEISHRIVEPVNRASPASTARPAPRAP